MQGVLVPQEITKDGLKAILLFPCGDSVWAVAAANWITQDSASISMDKGTRIWLYHDEILVGYGSLGFTRWKEVPRKKLALIPSLAILLEFQRKPEGVPKEQRYSRQLINHLIKEAVKSDAEYMVLEVHENNEGAIKLYKEVGFEFLTNPVIKTFNGVDHKYRRMAMAFAPRKPIPASDPATQAK